MPLRVPVALLRSIWMFSFVVAACGSDSGSLDPSDVTATDLEGYWVATGVDSIGQPLVTTFGFSNAARAALNLPLAQNDLTAPPGASVSVVYVGTPYSTPSDQQYATYSVSGGELFQTILGDVSAPPGTQYSTTIRAFTQRESMSLESSMSPTGERTYVWHERCPAPNQAGWNQYAGYVNGCVPAIPLGNSLAFDAHGDVHAVHGIGSAASCEQPTYAYITGACLPRYVFLPNFTASAIDVTDDVVRVALALGDQKLVVYARGLDEPNFREVEVIDAAPGTVRGLRFVEGADKPTLHWSGTVTGVELLAHSYTLEASGTWTKRSDDAMLYPLGSSIAPNGDAYFVKAGMLHRVTQAGVAVGAPMMVPRATTGNTLATSIPHVTPDGRVQIVVETRALGDNPGGSGGMVIGNEAYFVEWNGTAWTETLLGNQYGAWIVTAGNGPSRVVVAAQKAATPELVMHTIEDGVVVDSELAHPGGPFAPGSTPDYFHVPTAVVSADGDIATTFDGTSVYVRRGEVIDRMKTMTMVHFNGGVGNVRIYSDDGRYDCSEDCMIATYVGENVLFHTEASPGWKSYIDCPSGNTYGADSCRVPIRAANGTIVINSVRSALERELTVGIPSSMSVATMFDALGDKLVLQAEFNPGIVDYQVGSVEMTLDAAVPRALVSYDRTTEDAWITPIPVAPLAIAAAADGGAWLVAAVNEPTEFGDTTLGVSGQVSLVRVHYDASGDVVSADMITSGARSVFSVGAADIDAEGVVAAVTRNDSASSFVRAPATGTPTTTPLPAVVNDSLARKLIVDGTQSLVVFDGALVLMDGSVIAGTRELAAGAVFDAAFDGTRIVAIVSNNAAIDLGGATCDAFASCVVQYDDALDYDAHDVATSLRGTGNVAAVAVVAGGSIVSLGNRVWKYDAELVRTVEPIDHPVAMALASGQDDDSLMILSAGRLLELKPE